MPTFIRGGDLAFVAVAISVEISQLEVYTLCVCVCGFFFFGTVVDRNDVSGF